MTADLLYGALPLLLAMQVESFTRQSYTVNNQRGGDRFNNFHLHQSCFRKQSCLRYQASSSPRHNNLHCERHNSVACAVGPFRGGQGHNFRLNWVGRGPYGVREGMRYCGRRAETRWVCRQSSCPRCPYRYNGRHTTYHWVGGANPHPGCRVRCSGRRCERVWNGFRKQGPGNEEKCSLRDRERAWSAKKVDEKEGVVECSSGSSRCTSSSASEKKSTNDPKEAEKMCESCDCSMDI